jgi:acetylornithine deacetylase/succinyl-diaminopimelate desuccinylase-like protein
MLPTVIDLLGELIAVPSVNPRLAGPGDACGEESLTQWLVHYATEAGWRWALQRVHPERANFLALIPGERGDTLLWEAHQDTVSAQGMEFEPFAATVRDGRVFGRGACDVKGSMAAMLVALRRATLEPARDRPNILLTCTVNEECGFTGARALAEIWREPIRNAEFPGPGASLIPPLAPPFEGGGLLTLAEVRALRPSAALVAEPTDLNVVVAHRGVVRWQCLVHGRAAHSSRPEQGANAIYAMAKVVRLIEDFHRIELAGRPIDPLCGPSTACVTTIHGGTGANTVPDRAVIDIDRRLRPAELPDGAVRELVAYLADRVDLGDCRLEHEPPWMQSRGLSDAANRDWAEQLASVARAAGVASEVIGVPFGTNAASIAAAGIPTVVLGPGSIAQAHTADEWIAVEQLKRAVDVLYRVACGGIGLEA